MPDARPSDVEPHAQDGGALLLRPAGPVIPAADMAVWTEARAALDEARRWAKAKKARATAAYRKEKQRGHQEGFRAGAAEAAALMVETTAAVDRHLAGLESDLPHLVLDIVEQVLGEFDPGEVLAHAVRRALASARADTAVTLAVAPAMAKPLAERLAALMPEGTGAEIAIEADAGLDGAACAMKSVFGVVELDIDSQLAALRQGIGAATPGEG